MKWHFGAFAVIPCVVIASCASHVPQDITASWYPLEPGGTWVYQKEDLEGNMAHPDAERWGEDDCDGPGWQHFSRADGTSFRDKAACLGYSSNRK